MERKAIKAQTPANQVARRESISEVAAPQPELATGGLVDFESLAALLWRRKWVIGACLAAGLAAGVITALVQKPVYRATTTVEIQIPNDDYLNRRQLDPSLPPGVQNIDPYLQTEMKRLSSDSMLWKVAETLDVRHALEFRPKPGKSELERGALLEALRNRLVVRLAGQAQVVEISFEANDAKLAAAFANTLVDDYRAESLEHRRSTARQSAELLEGQLGTVQRNLDSAQARLQQFVLRKGVMSGLDREGLAEARLRQLQVAHVTAQEARIAEESRFTETMAALQTPDQLDNDTIAKYRVQLAELERRRAEAQELYQPEHYKVRQVEAEIATLQRSMEAEKANLVARMKTQVNAAAARERTIATNVGQQATLAANQVASEVEFTSLKHDVEGSQQLFDSLQQKVREAKIAAAVPSNTVLVLDKADRPFEPVRPKRLFLIAIGGFCGLMAGLLIAVGSATGARNTQQAPAPRALPAMLIPHLASIPRFEAAAHGAAELGASHQPESPFADSFRRLAARAFMAHSHFWPRILVVTGLEPHRGSTTVAMNLAITLAKEGQSVLFADAAGMNPDVQIQLGIRGGRVLMAPVSDATDSQPLCPMWTTAIAGLSLVRLDGAAALEANNHTLHELESDFDAIIVDAPVLTTWPESVWSHRFADGVLLVAGREALASSCVNQLLAGLPVSVLGSVANNAASVAGAAKEIA